MNVPMAFYLFPEPVFTAMHLYSNHCADLADSVSTQAFSRRVSNLIKAMMSRTPKDVLRENCEEYDAISIFLSYLNDWKEYAKKSKLHFLSQSTCLGLKVTLKATLEVFHFLKKRCDLPYLMTSRLNQDALERFFGLVRQACGSNEHPNSTIFVQVFRLLSVYSLIKPRKGSNVEGVEILNSMLNFKVVKCEKKGEELCEVLDRVISQNDLVVDHIPTFLERVQDHNQLMCTTPEFVQEFVVGYFAYRAKKMTTCLNCVNNLRSEGEKGGERYRMINRINRGRLQFPSQNLYKLIDNLENMILQVLAGGSLNRDTFIHIHESLDHSHIHQVGCVEPKEEFTRRVLSFYLITRSHFIAKRYNSIHDAERKKSKKLRKDSKL